MNKISYTVDLPVYDTVQVTVSGIAGSQIDIDRLLCAINIPKQAARRCPVRRNDNSKRVEIQYRKGQMIVLEEDQIAYYLSRSSLGKRKRRGHDPFREAVDNMTGMLLNFTAKRQRNRPADD